MRLVQSEPIICIDPGTNHSGVVVFDGLNVSEVVADIDNDEILEWMARNHSSYNHLAIEMVASYGMAVGASTFETVLWIGRFMQEFGFENCTKIYRKDVKMFLCSSMRAKDKNIRQAILDMFPATGGGKTPQIGTKAQPGPLYGVSSHAFSALAVGLTYKYAPVDFPL